MLAKLLFAGLLLSSGVCVAQADFRPGYILPLTGDTIRGAVDFRGEQRNGVRCRFRPGGTGDIAEYQPAQLRGYGFSASPYSPEARHYQSRRLGSSAAAPTVFVRVLFLGKASLYRHLANSRKDTYYVQAPGETYLRLLPQRDSVLTEYSRTRARTATVQMRAYPYRGILQYALADCPGVQSTLAEVELKQDALVPLFVAYSLCVKAPMQYVAPSGPSHTRLVVLGGLRRASLTFEDNGQQQFSATGPVVGLGLDFLPDRINPHLSFHLQGFYAQQNLSKQYTAKGYGVFSDDDVQRDVALNLQSVWATALMRYTFASGAVRPYVQAGGLGLANIRREGRNNTTVPRFANAERSSALVPNRFGLGIVGAAGVQVPLGAGSVLLELRAEQHAKPVADLDMSGIRGLELLVGYSFGR